MGKYQQLVDALLDKPELNSDFLVSLHMAFGKIALNALGLIDSNKSIFGN